MTEQQLKKGLFRLWIVVSVCWVCYWHFDMLYLGSFLSSFFGFLFVPPVILLILGKSIFWAVKGFKKSD